MANHRRKSQDEETTYWLSYSDMMAAVLLVFVLIISFTMLKAQKQYEEKTAELENQQELIAEQQLLLDEKQTLLDEQQTLLDEQQTLFDEQQTQLEQQQSELAEKTQQLEEQKSLLEEQEQLVKDQQERMDYQQQQLDNIIGVRAELIEALKMEFEGTELSVTVDPQTGAITFDSSILFDVNKSELKSTGKGFLDGFLPRYISVLLKDEYRSYISEIIIEGHTDTKGTYMHNLKLSQERALSVATFCLNDENANLSQEQREELRSIITANGKSYSNPVYNEDGSVNMDASRRVEFKFRLKDEEMVNEMISLLSD